MLSVTAIAVDGNPALFIQAHDCPVDMALQEQLPAWVWMCDEARDLDVFLQINTTRVLHCPITQLLLLAER
jgi:hypothetical protein